MGAFAAMLAVSCGQRATTSNDVVVDSFPVEAKVTVGDGQALIPTLHRYLVDSRFGWPHTLKPEFHFL